VINYSRHIRQSQVLFDAGDIDYLVLRFTLPQLRQELRHAETEASVCHQFDDSDGYYWQDYAAAVRLAIDIKRWLLAPSKTQGKHAYPNHPQAEDVKSRNDIVQVVSRYVQLKRCGHNFIGLCPFHNDRRPSFTVYPKEQKWWCYGCSRGGDVISFVR